MRIFRLKNSSSRGDTIVEVLIVVAVLALAFSISAATANQSLVKSRNAEEHSQALGLLNAQVELLRSAIAKKTDTRLTTPFCLDGLTVAKFDDAPPTDAKQDSDDGYEVYPAECQASTDGQYKQSIAYRGDGNYDVRIRWDGPGVMGPQQESFAYRVHDLTPGETSGVPLDDSASRINVTVNAIQPNAGSWINVDPTPSCGSPNPRQGVDNAGITLNQLTPAGAAKNGTTSGGQVTFSPLSDYYSFNTTLDSIPAGFVRCGPATSSTVSTAPGSDIDISYTIAPRCEAVPNQRDYLGYYADYLGTYADYLGYYADYLGFYGDPYTVTWWQHVGPDYRHAEWNTTTPPYSIVGNVHEQWEGGTLFQYQRVGSAFNAAGPWYNRFQFMAATAYTAPYDHWSAPYHHYSAPYAHYSAPYHHHGPYYTRYTCPTP